MIRAGRVFCGIPCTPQYKDKYYSLFKYFSINFRYNKKINKNTYIVVVTQGYEYDFKCLEMALKTKASYIGFISSKVKKIKFIRMLRELKISERQIERIHAPMGLDIGAETPEEIAIAIMSELIAIHNDSIHGSLKFNYKYPSKTSKTKNR